MRTMASPGHRPDALRDKYLRAWHGLCSDKLMDIANPLFAQRKRRRKRIAIGAGALLLAGLAVGVASLGPA